MHAFNKPDQITFMNVTCLLDKTFHPARWSHSSGSIRITVWEYTDGMFQASVEISCPNIVVTTAAMHVLNEVEEQLRHTLAVVTTKKLRTVLEEIDALTANKCERSATSAQT